MILLGLDPAFRENGFAAAIYDPADTTEPLRFIVFRNVLGFIGWVQNDAPTVAYACVENSNLDHAVYHLTPRMNARHAAASEARCKQIEVVIAQLERELAELTAPKPIFQPKPRKK
jgi:hypothetical protein